MSNSDVTPPNEAWKPLAALPSEDSLHLDSGLDTHPLADEINSEVSEVGAEPAVPVEGHLSEAEDSEIDESDVDDVDESEFDEASDASDDAELADLPVHERLEINPESGAVSGKPYENKHRKGTLPWIQTEHEASVKLLDEVEEEFERNRNVLKIAISMSRSARVLKDEKLGELSKYQETRDSLAEWIAERQGTYAWTLLEALGKERDKLDEFEKSVKNWTETTTTEIIEQSRKNKKKFIRRIGFGFAGIFLALGVGALVNLFLGWLGITWIVTLLAFIGFTNPFVWVPNFLIGGSIATWLASLFGYFRSYMKWRKMVDRHVAEARYYVSAVKSLQSEKGRILSLHGQMEDYLKLLSEILHKPWEISDEWLNWATPQLNTNSLPTSLVVAKPLESGEYEAVRKHSLETFAAGDWHSEQVRVLFAEYEKAQKMNTGAMEDRFDKDVRLRAKFLVDLEESDLLAKVGDEFVQSLARKLQSDDLPQATQFHVASIKPDLLENLDLSKSMFDNGQTNKNWTAFVAEILGKATAWSPLTYSTAGLFDRLEKQSEVTSYALIPDRIKTVLDSSVTPVIMDGTSGSGVEVVVRVDVSQWIEPAKVAILDDSKARPAGTSREGLPMTTEPRLTSYPGATSGHVTF
jgi:hypothetical protein